MPPSPAARRIVVTGVSRGLGRAMAEGFVCAGHVVAGCARCRRAIEQLCRHFGPPHSFTVVDVADDAQVARWARQVLAEGPVDLLINNAGLINANAPLWEVPAKEFAQVVDTNLKGAANMIRHFAPSMVRRQRGVIVNFSSGWGRSTAPEVAPYCATKWAIEGLTRALAQELPKGMAAVALNPGIINTQMLQSCFGEEANSYIDPERWAAKAIPFLLQLGPKDNGKSLSVP